jgi:soluble lytic murein transglycosylase-like protein
MSTIIIPPSSLVTLAKIRATMAGVDPALTCAVCEQESEWNPWAIRYEPAFYERYVLPLKLSPTVSFARSTSWGLMQLMGETAREEGYMDDLPKLCDPQTGLDRGLVHLKRELNRAAGNQHMALQFWNGGSNPAYGDQVLARMAKYQ